MGTQKKQKRGHPAMGWPLGLPLSYDYEAAACRPRSMAWRASIIF